MTKPSTNNVKKRSLATAPNRVDFSTLGTPTAIKGVRHYTLENGHGRDFRISDIEQLQDSLLARPEFNDARRYAVLATALEEPGPDGFASRGIGGNGILGLSAERMPIKYIGSGPKYGGLQIHHSLEQMRGLERGAWHEGGVGGPTIKNAKDGHDKFWSENDVRNATLILNKSFIRPAERIDAWNNRANTALMLQKHSKKK